MTEQLPHFTADHLWPFAMCGEYLGGRRGDAVEDGHDTRCLACLDCLFGGPVPSKPRLRLVVIESPYGRRPDGERASPAEVEANLAYLRECMAHSLARGEAPFASHGLYTQPGVLDDRDSSERRKGMDAGFAWGARADRVVVYCDRGVTLGMREGVERARRAGQPVEYRRIDGPWGRA